MHECCVLWMCLERDRPRTIVVGQLVAPLGRASLVFEFWETSAGSPRFNPLNPLVVLETETSHSITPLCTQLPAARKHRASVAESELRQKFRRRWGANADVIFEFVYGRDEIEVLADHPPNP